MQKIFTIARKVKNKLVATIQNQELEKKINHYDKNIPELVEIKEIIKKNILFFVPEAGVKPHFITSAIIAKTLQEQGNNVLFVRCFNVFERCPTLAMHNFTADTSNKQKKTICSACRDNSEAILGEYNLSSVDIRHFISEKQLQEIKELLRKAPQNLLEFSYNDISFGKLATFELSLIIKISDFSNISAENRVIWLQLIQTAIASYIVADNLQKKYNFDTFISNSFYVGALGIALVAQKHKVNYLYCSEAVHINIDKSKFIITNKMFWQNTIHWKDWKDLALLPQQVSQVYKDLLNHFVGIGSHQYSPSAVAGNNKELFEKLNIPKNKKILVAYNSSEDETLGYNYLASVMGWNAINEDHNAFKSQLEWLKEVSDFVENSKDYHLIIRLHPRLGKNKRESKVSTHYAELKEILEKSPSNAFKNVTIIWPEEQISSYKLLDFADLVLVSWSSLSIDVGRLAIPVLSYTKRIATFPIDDNDDNSFITIATEKHQYFQQIAQLVNRKREIKHIKMAMRWYNMRHLAGAVDVDDLMTHSQENLPNFSVPREHLLIEKAILEEDAILKEHLRRQKSVQKPSNNIVENVLAQETKAIQRVLRQFIHFNITGEILKNDKEIAIFAFSLDNKKDSFDIEHSNPFQAILVYDGLDIEYIYLGKTYKYYSLLCVQLSELCKTNQ